MRFFPNKPPAVEACRPKPVTFHCNVMQEPGKPFGHTAFLVIVADEALLTLNKDHPLRYLKLRFNGCATPARRVQALADALRELETDNQVEDTTIANDMLARCLARLSRLFLRPKPAK